MDLENVANPDIGRRNAIAAWKSTASVDVDLLPHVESTAEELARLCIKPMDPLHVASALSAKAAWLLTTVRATQESGDEN